MRQQKDAKPTNPNNIGWCIKKYGYTQGEVADAIGIARRTLSNYIAGKTVVPHYCLEKIARVIGCDIVELTDNRQEENPQQKNKEEDIEKYFQRRSARLHTWVIDSLEDGTQLRWQLYYTGRNSLTQEGLFRQIERLEQLADEGIAQKARVYHLLIQNYQLAGSLARDNFHYIKAKTYFTEAQKLAEDLPSPDLSSTSVARHALVLMRQAGNAEANNLYGKYIADALRLYQRANELAVYAEPYVRAYILSGLAEALARNGLVDDCYRSLDNAERLLGIIPDIAPEEDIAHVRLTLQSLEDARGECYVLLGEPKKGLEYLQNAQKQLDPTISRNLCRLLMQQAEAYLAAGYLDQCVSYALQGLQIARTLESASNVNWSREIYQKLLKSHWKNEALVKELGSALLD